MLDVDDGPELGAELEIEAPLLVVKAINEVLGIPNKIKIKQ